MARPRPSLQLSCLLFTSTLQVHRVQELILHWILLRSCQTLATKLYYQGKEASVVVLDFASGRDETPPPLCCFFERSVTKKQN